MLIAQQIAKETSVPVKLAETRVRRTKKLFSYKAEHQAIGNAEKRFTFDFFNTAINAAFMKLGECFDYCVWVPVFGYLCDVKSTANFFSNKRIGKSVQ